jgi:methylase of polypeptide subunit release factors
LTKQASSRASLEALYVEVKRLDQLRTADQLATSTALTAAEKAVAAALSASEKAVDKAEITQKGINEGQNEFRATLRDQAATLMPRAETESLIRELRGLISAQTEVINGLRSRMDIGPPSLGVLQARSDQQQGRMTGWNDIRLLVLALAAVGGFVLAFIGFFGQ